MLILINIYNKSTMKCRKNNRMICCNSELLKSVLEKGCGFQCFQSLIYCFEDLLIKWKSYFILFKLSFSSY